MSSLELTDNERALLDLILTKEWYYYDPDELGEDAFKRLKVDEVEELFITNYLEKNT